MATGNIGGIPNSTERSSGAIKPTDKAPGAAQHKAAQQDGKMHGAEHVAHLGHMAGDHGQHKGQREKQGRQHDAAGGRSVWFSW